MSILLPKPQDGWNDERRYDFLKHLDERNEVELSDWEGDFLESAIEGYEFYKRFTDPMRKVIDNLADKYGI